MQTGLNTRKILFFNEFSRRFSNKMYIIRINCILYIFVTNGILCNIPRTLMMIFIFRGISQNIPRVSKKLSAIFRGILSHIPWAMITII